MTITIGHDRVPRVFWGADAPGAEVWLGSETSTSLDPDGCVVRRHDAAATESTEDTGAFETANESADAMPHTSAKKTQKGCKGGGLPLDKEPSNGCPLGRRGRSRCGWHTRPTSWHSTAPGLRYVAQFLCCPARGIVARRG